MIELKPVQPTEIQERWGWLRKGVEACIRKSVTHAIPEDIYADLRARKYVLFVIVSDSDELGWVMLQEQQDYDRKALFIFMLWGEKLAPHEQDIYAAIEKLAQGIGITRIRFEGREGWMRRGWAKAVRRVYERELI